uniref:60S ribosomal protein L34 n=1 Tax=Heterorhabditis bacteriophora TaxID=37862 RepID=A0A1I7WTU0_HETBA
MSPPSKSVPIPIHRSASHTPSMMVNAKKYLSDRPQLLDCPRCRAFFDAGLNRAKNAKKIARSRKVVANLLKIPDEYGIK